MSKDHRAEHSRGWGKSTADTSMLLLGGFVGAGLLSVLQVPAGALIGAVLGSVGINKLVQTIYQRKLSNREPIDHALKLPAPVRITGQILIGVMAGAQLDGETLTILTHSLIPVFVAVVAMLIGTLLLARYLFCKHQVDPLTAIMAAAPGGVSELAISAAQKGARMHVVLAIHLFRIMVVVLVVLPLLLLFLQT